MDTDNAPLKLVCPIRGELKTTKKKGADLSALEERQRIDAIRHLISLGYKKENIKIEAVIAKFGNDGKNSFRCDLAVLDVPANTIDSSASDGVENLLKHSIILSEIKRDNNNYEYVKKTQVEPLLKFSPLKSTIGLYWDSIEPRVFWRQDEGGSLSIKSGPLALLPKPGIKITVKPLRIADLTPPLSLLDVFSRMEDVLHAASISLENRYECLLQFILAKLYDEHQSDSDSERILAFQDFEAIGTPISTAAETLNDVLEAAAGFYGAHLPKAVDPTFEATETALYECARIFAPHKITSAKKEVIQTFYMKFAKDFYRWDLAQYFTPPTVTDFIIELLNPTAGELVKDPACGSADFLVASFQRSKAKKINNAADAIFGTDSEEKAVQISVLNMLLNGDGKTNIKKEDSLKAVADASKTAGHKKGGKSGTTLHDVLVCNPPFGVKIVEKRGEILQKFDLAHQWEKDAATGFWKISSPEKILKSQQKGILFAEVCVRQTKAGGRIGIILPNGYLGNRSEPYAIFREWLLRQCRIVSICGFPRFTFKTSGADVSASIVVLEKRIAPLADSTMDNNYVFNAEVIDNVGWSVGDKKSSPIYMQDEKDGSFLSDNNGQKIIKTDFPKILTDIRNSGVASQHQWIRKNLGMPVMGNNPLGWSRNISVVLNDVDRTLDPKRHSRKYVSLMTTIASQPHIGLMDIFEYVPERTTKTGRNFKVSDESIYHYVEIDLIGAGDYRPQVMRGWKLPDRAKHPAEPLDVFVGSIWSSVSKWCLISTNTQSNTVVTNGCHRLRLREGMEAHLLDAVAFFCTETYHTQMRALARGSDGLAEIHENDLAKILVPRIVDQDRRNSIQPYLDALKNGIPSLRSQIISLFDSIMPVKLADLERPHHASLL